jgi:plastocyanin
MSHVGGGAEKDTILGKTVALAGVLGLTIGVAALLLGGTPASAVDQTVEVGDIWYCDMSGDPCVTNIDAGDTVIWDFEPSDVFHHTVTHCGLDCDEPTTMELFDSGIVEPDDPDLTYDYTFSIPGEYPYYCVAHPGAQRGLVVVAGAAQIGDVNGSGVIDAIDAALVLQFGAELLDWLWSLERADTNVDTNVNAIDAALVLQYNAGLIDTLPP